MSLLVYNVDTVVTGNCAPAIQTVILQINTEFKFKDLGVLNNQLTMEVRRNEGRLLLNQKIYMFKLLLKMGLDATPIPTLMTISCMTK